MKMSKWKIKFVVIGLLTVICLCVWWSVSTKDSRVRDSRYKQFVKIADMQAVEIAILEQASKLEQYKNQIAKNQKVAQEKIKKQPSVAVDPVNVIP